MLSRWVKYISFFTFFDTVSGLKAHSQKNYYILFLWIELLKVMYALCIDSLKANKLSTVFFFPPGVWISNSYCFYIFNVVFCFYGCVSQHVCVVVCMCACVCVRTQKEGLLALWIGADKCSVERAAVSAVESMTLEPMGKAMGENSTKYLRIHWALLGGAAAPHFIQPAYSQQIWHTLAV